MINLIPREGFGERERAALGRGARAGGPGRRATATALAAAARARNGAERLRTHVTRLQGRPMPVPNSTSTLNTAATPATRTALGTDVFSSRVLRMGYLRAGDGVRPSARSAFEPRRPLAPRALTPLAQQRTSPTSMRPLCLSWSKRGWNEWLEAWVSGRLPPNGRGGSCSRVPRLL